MNDKIFLRIASGLLIFHLAGHSIGNATWDQTDDPIKQNVIQEMTGHQFPFMGTNRSMGEYFYGYGLITSVALVVFAAYLIFLSFSLDENRNLIKKLIWVTTLGLLGISSIEFIYFFPLAAGTTLLASLFSMMAAISMSKKKQ
ncbi:LIC_13387 family protein [Leptospira perdikensis]|uniref:Uncharacterized protein n=1 Tax=Leptospira perdikensis TaxID=2484948 RepID=A0A4R9JGP4_9LEPT|nr:hypothetical protein [Leptospira perdikensis]TGL41459.1 hypothetical protein EHQ49_07790 [Leptospira perdikensis]